MTGDKLRRMQAVRSWLEKAEKAYAGHKELSGEWNLIMAQAEMQRLKETDGVFQRRKRWTPRILAFAAALSLVTGYSLLNSAEKRGDLLSSPHRVELKVTTHALTAGEDIPREAEPAAPPGAVSLPPAETTPASEAPAPAEPAAAAPVLSEAEIQSVVGEAGRALRGQP